MSAQPKDDAMQRFGITIFKDRLGAACRRGSSNIVELIDLIEKSNAIRKDDLPLFKLALFGEARTAKGCLRHDANVVEVTGVEGDYDGENMTMIEAYEVLAAAGIEALLYSSPSSSPDAPRWRVIAPFAASISGAEAEMRTQRAEMVQRLDDVLGGILASESYALSQSFYFGRVMGRPAVEMLRTEGRCIDELAELDTSRPQPGKKDGKLNGDHSQPDKDSDDAELVRRILQGDHRHNAVRSLTSRYVARGMGAAGIIQLIHGLMDASDLTRDSKFQKRYAEVAKVVAGAFDKGFAPPQNIATRPIITVRTGRITEARDAVAVVLAESAESLGVYVNGSRLVRPYTTLREGFAAADGKRELVESLELMPLTLATFQDAINRGCAFEQWRQDKNKSPYSVKIDCPVSIAKSLFEAPDAWQGWPRIERVSETPIFDGKGLHCGPGLVGATWVLSPDDVKLPKGPSRKSAEAALQRLQDWQREFPYATAGDKAAAIALLMTAAMRSSLGAAPFFIVTKSDYGSGASTQARLAGVVAIGRSPAVMSLGKSEEETAKLIGAALIQGRAVMMFDNLREGEPFTSTLLAQVITEPSAEIRELGLSRTHICDTQKLIVATGVNVTTASDLTRRGLSIRIDPKMENPADRTFERPNLIEDARLKRAAILSDCFTITAAYLASGEHAKTSALAGFEQFVRWIAEPLVWLGLPDIIESARAAKAANPDDVLLGRILPLWRLIQAPRGMTVHELVHTSGGAGVLELQYRKELKSLLGEATNAREVGGIPELTTRAVTRWIARMEGRFRGKVRFVRDPKGTESGLLWKAATAGGANGDPDLADFADSFSHPLHGEHSKCSMSKGLKSWSAKSAKSAAHARVRGRKGACAPRSTLLGSAE
jgi:hypothetical protein